MSDATLYRLRGIVWGTNQRHIPISFMQSRNLKVAAMVHDKLSTFDKTLAENIHGDDAHAAPDKSLDV
jgi:hypothetical protein